MIRLVVGVAAAAASLSAPALAGASGVWDFTLIQPQSGLSATLSNTAQTSGTLIGDFDATSNPTGTRTKPGLFGSFGDTENVSVAVNALGASLSGAVNTQSSGGYRLTIDTSSGTISMENYAANLLASGPASLPISISLSTESFRTRNPSSIYPAIPITLPIGSANLTQLSFAQAGPGVGTLTPTGAETYSFTILTTVNLAASFDVLGNAISLPGAVPVPFALAGSLVIAGDVATISSLVPIDLSQSQQPGITLPQVPLPLPSLAGTPANVLLDLTLSSIGVEVDGQFTSVATGVRIPAPGAFALLGVGVAALRRRRH